VNPLKGMVLKKVDSRLTTVKEKFTAIAEFTDEAEKFLATTEREGSSREERSSNF